MDYVEFSKIEKLLRQQINEIEALRVRPAYNPKYRIWENTTIKILNKCFDSSYVEMFENSGPSVMAMNEEHHYKNYLTDLDEKKLLLEGFLQETEKNLSNEEINFVSNKKSGIYDLHPEIKNVSMKLFEDSHYPQAIEEAFKRVISEVKRIYKEETSNELDGDTLMNKSMGCENQVPIIKFNSLGSIEDKDEQKGIMFLFKGIVGIRNKKAHSNIILEDKEKAFEYLVLASLLFRLLENSFVP